MNINTHDKYFNDFIYFPIPNLHGYDVLWVTIFMFQLLLDVDTVTICELKLIFM